MTTERQSKGPIRRRDVHGILLLDKPKGMSSNAALQRVRYLLRARKGGHTGSLDPLATGMLPLCFGDATRFSHAMLDADKTYRVEMTLGQSSTTGDAEGDKSVPVSIPTLDLAGWQRVADQFIGEIEQVPPMYSALKHQGKRLYELARQGQAVERPPRRVTIHSLAVDAVQPATVDLTVTCSKGTYIRTLVEDLAATAGTQAWTSRLHRVSVAPFGGDMLTLTAIEAADEQGEPIALLPVDAGLSDWPALQFDEAQSRRFCSGQTVPVSTAIAGRCCCYGPDGLFLGSGSSGSDPTAIKPDRVMSSAQAVYLPRSG
ncbi:MAG: tRNA pseudouridine(55) synthase TruB [Pseudomonadota bacterium]